MPGDTVYDIGAGSGVITSVLAAHGCNVTAVELEPQTAQILRRNTANYQNVTIIESDFLALELPSTTYIVFANIPFHLSSEIIQKLTEATNPPRIAYLIVQKQFASKLLPDFAGSSSQLGMIIGPRFSARILQHLKRTDFLPHPNVDTVLLELQLREQPLIHHDKLSAYNRLVSQAFSDPKYFAKLAIPRKEIDPGVKPSQLTLSEWIMLFNTQRL